MDPAQDRLEPTMPFAGDENMGFSHGQCWALVACVVAA